MADDEFGRVFPQLAHLSPAERRQRITQDCWPAVYASREFTVAIFEFVVVSLVAVLGVGALTDFSVALMIGAWVVAFVLHAYLRVRPALHAALVREMLQRFGPQAATAAAADRAAASKYGAEG